MLINFLFLFFFFYIIFFFWPFYFYNITTQMHNIMAYLKLASGLRSFDGNEKALKVSL